MRIPSRQTSYSLHKLTAESGTSTSQCSDFVLVAVMVNSPDGRNISSEMIHALLPIYMVIECPPMLAAP
jgi:hypothetical protein